MRVIYCQILAVGILTLANGCRSQEGQKSLEYRKWPTHALTEYPASNGAAGEFRSPFDWRMFFDEDIHHVIPAKGGGFKVQCNLETRNVSRGPFFKFASAKNKDQFPYWIETMQQNWIDSLSTGDVIGFSKNNPTALKFEEKGARIIESTITDRISEIQAGTENWLTIKINGYDLTIEIIVKPNKTGMQREMNIGFSANIGLMYTFNNETLRIVQLAE